MHVQRGGARTVARGQVERDADRLVQLQQLRVVPAAYSAMRRQRDGGRAKVRRLRRGARTMAPRSGAECRRRAACRRAPAAARPSACPARRRKAKTFRSTSGRRGRRRGRTHHAEARGRLVQLDLRGRRRGSVSVSREHPRRGQAREPAADDGDPHRPVATGGGGGRRHGAVLLAQRHQVQG